MPSHNGGTPFRATGTGHCLSFCPDCSEVIFIVSLLVPVLHPHRLAETFLRQLLSSSPHFSLFVIISLPIFSCQELSCQQIQQKTLQRTVQRKSHYRKQYPLLQTGYRKTYLFSFLLPSGKGKEDCCLGIPSFTFPHPPSTVLR